MELVLVQFRRVVAYILACYARLSTVAELARVKAFALARRSRCACIGLLCAAVSQARAAAVDCDRQGCRCDRQRAFFDSTNIIFALRVFCLANYSPNYINIICTGIRFCYCCINIVKFNIT